MEKPAPDEPIWKARDYIKEHMADGCHCPACSQYVKLYGRKITSAMAAGLIILYKAEPSAPGKPIHIEEYFNANGHPPALRGDFAKLRWWELVNRHEERPGFYSITPKGQYFVEGKIQVPRSCYIYNNECHGFSNKMTDINKALGDKFSYPELMGEDFDPKYKTIATQGTFSL